MPAACHAAVRPKSQVCPRPCPRRRRYHQKEMLEDSKRTGAYYNAVMQNRRCFHDKVVLDVGTGSGERVVGGQIRAPTHRY